MQLNDGAPCAALSSTIEETELRLERGRLQRGRLRTWKGDSLPPVLPPGPVDLWLTPGLNGRLTAPLDASSKLFLEMPGCSAMRCELRFHALLPVPACSAPTGPRGSIKREAVSGFIAVHAEDLVGEEAVTGPVRAYGIAAGLPVEKFCTRARKRLGFFWRRRRGAGKVRAPGRGHLPPGCGPGWHEPLVHYLRLGLPRIVEARAARPSKSLTADHARGRPARPWRRSCSSAASKCSRKRAPQSRPCRRRPSGPGRRCAAPGARPAAAEGENSPSSLQGGVQAPASGEGRGEPRGARAAIRARVVQCGLRIHRRHCLGEVASPRARLRSRALKAGSAASSERARPNASA